MVSNERDEKTIDLAAIFFCLLDRVWIIILVALISAVTVGIYTKIAVNEKYTSAAVMYVQNKDTDNNTAISQGDISAAASLVTVCQEIFTSDRMIDIVQNGLKQNGYVYTNDELRQMVSITSPNNNSVMTVNAISDRPEVSQLVAQLVVSNADKVFREIVKAGTVETISAATYPDKPSSPNVVKNMLIGFLAGFVIICGVFVVRYLCDKKIKPQDDLLELYGIPVFAEIMDADLEVKGGAGYEYSSKK